MLRTHHAVRLIVQLKTLRLKFASGNHPVPNVRAGAAGALHLRTIMLSNTSETLRLWACCCCALKHCLVDRLLRCSLCAQGAAGRAASQEGQQEQFRQDHAPVGLACCRALAAAMTTTKVLIVRSGCSWPRCISGGPWCAAQAGPCACGSFLLPGSSSCHDDY